MGPPERLSARMRATALLLGFLALPLLQGCGANPARAGDAGSPGDVTEATPAVVPQPAPAPRREARSSSTLARRPAAAREVPAPGGDYSSYPAAMALVDRLVTGHGFDRGQLNATLSRVERQQWILDYMSRPEPKPAAGPTGAWTRYRARFLTRDRIDGGLRFWRAHEETLERAHARYGVPPEYVVAIIGVETHYGANVGRHRVIDALATLAFDYPRRSEYFTGELESFLVMARDEGFDPFEPVGSYAGAMGLGQFMPSSFQRFAVDFDGDGQRDLWDTEDAIGSVANYFREHGWTTREPVVLPAVARGSEPHALEAGFSTAYRVSGLAEKGVTSRVGFAGDGEVSLLRLDAAGGYEYWLGLRNFYVITRYNHSTYYAMSVHQLAEAVRERRDGAARPVLTLRQPDGAPPSL